MFVRERGSKREESRRRERKGEYSKGEKLKRE